MNQDRQELYTMYQFEISAGDTVFGVASSEKERIELMQEAMQQLPGETVNVELIKRQDTIL